MTAAGWSLVSYRSRHGGPDGETRTGLLDGSGVVRALPDQPGTLSLREVVGDWTQWAPELRGLDPAGLRPAEGAALTAPLRYPTKVIGAGANYHRHVAEMGITGYADGVRPFLFLKPPTTTVIGPGEPIVLPARQGRQVDWEAELGVVIGRRCRHVTAAEAPEQIMGYTIVNDVSARDRLLRQDPLAPTFAVDWVESKAEDTFCPMGPGLVPSWFVDDPHRLAIRLSVNGVRKQDSSTDDMINGIWTLIEVASGTMTLEPGDVIATGTPAGVGFPRGEFLLPGDEVVIDIEGLGSLRNPVVDGADPQAST